MVISPAQADRDLDRLVHRIGEISTLPHTMLQIIRVTNDPLSSSKDLTRVIELDPALSARLLKCANSVAHGLTSRIKSLQQAVGYLGFSKVRNLAISASVCEVFKTDYRIGTYNRRGLWDHMIAVAVTSKVIAIRRNVPNPEDVFLAGLLHDLGIILLDQYHHEEFERAMSRYPIGRTLVQAERMAYGFDHTVLGTYIAERWRLPDSVRLTIRHHHTDRYDGNHAQTIACVELANVMCTSKGIGSVGVPLPGMSSSVLDHLNIETSDVKMLIEDMNEQIDQNSELFDLVTDETRQRLES
jgi:putative nucleotidyltransferase with HDIG domain